MTGTARRWPAYLLAAAGLALLLVATPVSGLEDSTKAIRVVGSEAYPQENVQAYSGELVDVGELDGAGGAIAVLDTGVDDNHPTFRNQFVAGAEWAASCACIRDTDPITGERINPDDGNGHGTHVASIALGQGTEDGPRGVAPGAGLVDVKIASDLGSATPNRIGAGIQWVMDYNEGKTNWTGNVPVEVIVIAFATRDAQQERAYADDAMEKIREAYDNDILVVAAAGNCGPSTGNVSQECSQGGQDRNTVASPAATPEAIAVGAVDDNDEPRRSEDDVDGYSSRGPNPAANASDGTWRKPDLVAPGTNITAACPEGIGDWRMDCTKSGTSMAAPHVAGLAMIVDEALEKGSDTESTPAKIEQILTETATDLRADGWDPVAGHGYVDAYEAVVEATNTPPESSFTVRPPDPEAGEQVTLDAANSSDPDQGDRVERFVWRIDDDREEKRPGDQNRLNVVFDEPGNHEIELTTIDSRGTEDPEPERATVYVAEPEAEEDQTQTHPPEPQIDHGWAAVDQEVTFDASNSTDPDGHELVGFAWDVDPEGAFAPDRRTEQPRLAWTFEEPGQHTVQVEVTDETGANATATVTFTVHEPEPDPPQLDITNPQEGDVVEQGTVNVTWIWQGSADTFGVSVDEAAVDSTDEGYLEVYLPEGERRITVTATGPGGEDVGRVNVTVVEEEDVDQAGGEQADDGEDPNPPRHRASEDDGDEASEQPTDNNETGTDGSASEQASTDANEAPASLALALAGLAVAGLAGRRQA